MHWTLLSAQALPLTAGAEANAVGQQESPSKSPITYRHQSPGKHGFFLQQAGGATVLARPAVLDRALPTSENFLLPGQLSGHKAPSAAGRPLWNCSQKCGLKRTQSLHVYLRTELLLHLP